MAETLKRLDWQNLHHGSAALRRIIDTFDALSPSNKPLSIDGIFKSDVQTGDASEQDIAHSLGATPSMVLVIPIGGLNVAGDITEGTHDATNCKVTAPNTMKYYVVAITV